MFEVGVPFEKTAAEVSLDGSGAAGVGLVTNSVGARDQPFFMQRLRGDACRFAPRSERTIPKVSVLSCTGQVPPAVEGVVRRSVKREESLR